VPGVVSYTYEFDGPAETVPAGPDGSASVVFTPTEADFEVLQVSGNFADGGSSDAAEYEFSVGSSAGAAISAGRLTR
jgi:hypothetical protein